MSYNSSTNTHIGTALTSTTTDGTFWVDLTDNTLRNATLSREDRVLQKMSNVRMVRFCSHCNCALSDDRQEQIDHMVKEHLEIWAETLLTLEDEPVYYPGTYTVKTSFPTYTTASYYPNGVNTSGT